MNRERIGRMRRYGWLVAAGLLLWVSPRFADELSKSTAEEVGDAISAEALEQARRIAAERHGLVTEDAIPEDVTVVHATWAELPTLERRLLAIKVDVGPAEVTATVTFDESGQEVDLEELHREEMSAWQEQHGRIDGPLAERLAVMGPEDSVQIIVWLRVDERSLIDKPAPDEPMTEEEVDALLQEALELQQADIARVVPEIAERLRALGVDVITTGTTAPWVGATLAAAQVREVASWEDVDRVYLSIPKEQSLDVARRAVGADLLHQRGIHGMPPGRPGGIPLGVIEVGGGRIRTASSINPLLNGVGMDVRGACSGINGHAMAVTSIIRSSDPKIRGVAYRAGVTVGGDCRGRNAELMQRTEEFLRGGMRAINYSLGDRGVQRPGPMSRFVDEQVFRLFRTFVSASGNEACTGDGWVNNPGQAYAGITVGAYDDFDTAARSDDRMWPCSNARSPRSRHGDRTKPELVAPGVDFTAAVPWAPHIGCVSSGTSYAAPVVTSGVALLMHRQPLFQVWPNALKALLLATADHNLEGSARLSARDGAGGLRVDLADDVLRQAVSGGWKGKRVTCNEATATVQTVPVTAGDRVRFVIAWPTDPSDGDYQERPSADFDLFVFDGNGQRVTTAASFDRTYEIVDVRPAATGSLSFQVRQHRCAANPGWLSWAWVVL